MHLKQNIVRQMSTNYAKKISIIYKFTYKVSTNYLKDWLIVKFLILKAICH